MPAVNLAAGGTPAKGNPGVGKSGHTIQQIDAGIALRAWWRSAGRSSRARVRRVCARLASVGLAGSVLTGLVLAGCGGGSGAGTSVATASTTNGGGDLSGKLTVLAAASLTETFTELGDRFEAKHPGLDVQFSFGASSALAQQVEAGAPADVFASASKSTMEQVVQTGDATEPATFARNVMEIAVPPGNPAEVDSIDDLARSDVTVAVCEAAVPCGAAAEKVFASAGVEVTPVTYGQDVKAVLTSVTLGEVDAGVVYVTDVRAAAGDVEAVPIPDDVNASTDYPIAVLADAPNPAAANAFAAFVTSEPAWAVFSEAGFLPPSPP